ncbi:MAG: hypothetical protein JW912_00700 [Sedimentisphaerales bacterium]|nr:hypothetical protein [Sedimentisphaerales bacterium]
MIPKSRMEQLHKKAVPVTSSATPMWVGKQIIPNTLSVMKKGAKCVGAKEIKTLYFYSAARAFVMGKKPDVNLGK